VTTWTECHRPCLPSQRLPDRLERPPSQYGSITSEWDHFAEWKRLDEATKGDVEAEVLLNACWRITVCSTSSRTSSCSMKARRQNSQGGGAQPSGARRQPCRRVRRPPGGAEARISRPSGASASRHRTAAGKAPPSPTRSGLEEAEAAGPTRPTVVHSRRANRHHRARPSDLGRLGVFCTRRVRQELFNGLLREKVRRRSRAISPSC